MKLIHFFLILIIYTIMWGSFIAVSLEQSQQGDTLSGKYGYRTNQEMLDRHKRFPLIDDRVKLYMSNWYLPPCNNTGRVAYEYLGNNDLLLEEPGGQRTFQLNNIFSGEKNVSGSFDHIHFFNLETMSNCNNRYCEDMVDNIAPALIRAHIGSTPIVFQFGDSWVTRGFRVDMNQQGFLLPDVQPHFPVIKKIHKSLSNGGLKELTSVQCMDKHDNQWQPVITKLNVKRHFGKIHEVSVLDLPWEEKIDGAIFRGQLTGKYDALTPQILRNITEVERCSLLPRCWISLVYHSATLVDARLTKFTMYNERYMLSPMIEYKSEQISLNGTNMSLKSMLMFKGLIMLEGNDVSSGLKWALSSNSVVLMPKPVYTSWAMEELLQPWVHYIPIDPLSTTDIDDKMQWILDHDEEAQRIARNGHLWISDMVLHPMAQKEDEAIVDEILRRYALHFRPAKSALPQHAP